MYSMPPDNIPHSRIDFSNEMTMMTMVEELQDELIYHPGQDSCEESKISALA